MLRRVPYFNRDWSSLSLSFKDAAQDFGLVGFTSGGYGRVDFSVGFGSGAAAVKALLNFLRVDFCSRRNSVNHHAKRRSVAFAKSCGLKNFSECRSAHSFTPNCTVGKMLN